MAILAIVAIATMAAIATIQKAIKIKPLNRMIERFYFEDYFD